MKLAFSKPTASEEETRLLFTRFRQVGYDGLQLKAGQYAPYLDQPERFIADWGQYPGSASALIVWGTPDDVRRTLTFGRTVGSEMIVFCHCVPRQGLTAHDLRDIAVSLSELGKEAQDHGLKLSLHHHYNQPVMHREDFEVFFDAVEEDTVGLTVDTAHLMKSGVSDIAGLIRDFGPVINNFHLKDFAGGEFKVLGSGAIDFEPVFGAIREIEYEGWVSADEESGAEVGGAMEQCFSFITAGLAALKEVWR
jgi:inosose dehydratase